MNILYILLTGATGGGILSCIQEGLGLELLGCRTRFCIISSESSAYLNNFNWAGLTPEHLTFYESKDALQHYVREETIDICIATAFHTAEIVSQLVEGDNGVTGFYYVQDYEPRFFNTNDLNHEIAKKSYHFGLHAFCKTNYLKELLKETENISVAKILPSIHDIFNAKGRANTKKPNIIGMYRPASSYRGPETLLTVFEKLYFEYGNTINLAVFGAWRHQCKDLPQYIKSVGILKSPEVAIMMKSADVFIDTSLHQGFGRTGIEAMRCGCIPILPKASGCEDYANHMNNSILTQPGCTEQILEGVKGLLEDRKLMHKLRKNAIRSSSNIGLRSACLSMLQYFDSCTSNSVITSNKSNSIQSSILIVKPLMMSNGMPTGSGYLRMVFPFLENTNKEVKTLKDYSCELPLVTSNPGVRKIAYFQRNGYTCNLSKFRDWANLWKFAGNKIVVDIDDDLFNVGELIDRVKNFDEAVAISLQVKEIVTAADLVTCSTDRLAERTRMFNPNVIIVPNRLSNKCWNLTMSPTVEKKISGKAFKIGYVGTPTHDRDLEIVSDPIRKILSEEPGLIEFEVIGAYQNISPPFGNKVWLPSRTEYPVFVEWLHKVQNWDIGLIPLVDDNFNKSKSNLKFLEYAALSIPIICSDVESYANIAKNMENCIVVNNSPSSWYDAIHLLKNDAELRKKLSDNAKSDIIQHYVLENYIDEVNRSILQLLG